MTKETRFINNVAFEMNDDAEQWQIRLQTPNGRVIASEVYLFPEDTDFYRIAYAINRMAGQLTDFVEEQFEECRSEN